MNKVSEGLRRSQKVSEGLTGLNRESLTGLNRESLTTSNGFMVRF